MFAAKKRFLNSFVNRRYPILTAHKKEMGYDAFVELSQFQGGR
jgi:hypothetical protein